MINLTRRAFVKTALGTSFALASGVELVSLARFIGPARRRLHWRMAVPLSDNFVTTQGSRYFRDLVFARSGGELNIELVQPEQGGAPASRIAEQVRRGIFPIGHCASNSCVGLVPQIEPLADIPFEVSSDSLSSWTFRDGRRQLD